MLDKSKQKAFADNKINVAQVSFSFSADRVENIWEEERMPIISIFSFSHNDFKGLFS